MQALASLLHDLDDVPRVTSAPEADGLASFTRLTRELHFHATEVHEAAVRLLTLGQDDWRQAQCAFTIAMAGRTGDAAQASAFLTAVQRVTAVPRARLCAELQAGQLVAQHTVEVPAGHVQGTKMQVQVDEMNYAVNVPAGSGPGAKLRIPVRWLPVQPPPGGSDGIVSRARAHVQQWHQAVGSEARLLHDLLQQHAVRLRRALVPRVRASASLHAAYRDVFKPFADTAELRAAIGMAQKGKTGRLTTVDELGALTDAQLEPFVLLAALIFAGEAPPTLKLGDVVPLP